MPFQSALPVAETEIGIAIEATRGTPVAPAYWLPVMAPKYKPDLKLLPDETLQGSMVQIYDEVPSLRNDGHGWDSYPYLDTFGVLLRALLGSTDTLTAAPANTTLSSGAAAGATTITTAATIAANSWIVIDTGVGVQETHLTTAVSGTGPFTVTLAYPLAFAHLSAATVTGLTKHQFSLLNNSPSSGNQPPSCTLTDFAGETNWRQLAAAQLDSLNLSGTAESLPKYTCNWFSQPATTPSAPTPSFSSAQAPPGWTVTLAVGGTQIAGGGPGGASGVLVDWEYDLKRNVKPIPAITGTQQYFQLFAGVIVPTAKITVLDDSSATWLTAFQNGTLESLDFTLADVKSGWALNLHSTKAKFTSGAVDRSKEWVEVPLEIQLLPSSTDALAGGVSPLLATVANAQTTQY
jgi:hypothetical protein